VSLFLQGSPVRRELLLGKRLLVTLARMNGIINQARVAYFDVVVSDIEPVGFAID